ncbi:Na+/solute symporter [Halothece sp. PCC 7418]|uniref:sodium:solute symporter family transporter n=1 Tax=Halothece sp. (strain PCC 7418) TaxID=65093 RepID=UPI0002A07B2E|nr:Na+/solute symporter [Halothece sp. PCC 7418]AFZ43827.1 Na+/solute symporter [Halothece sp. PCC 7418]
MQLLDYLIITLYLLTIVIFGFILQRKASQGIDAYFLGNRRLPWWALGASGMASNTDIAGTMIITALIYAIGIKGFFIEIRGGIVLIMAFFMIFMGKWTRRAQVMTLAEWMRLRFGEGREGNIARLISAIANLIISIWIISYFAVGGGKFFGQLLGIDDRLAAILMITLAMIYTAASGFYGVIWTDVFQGVLIFIAIIYVCGLTLSTVTLPETFSISVPLSSDEFQTIAMNLTDWSNFLPPPNLDLPGQYSAFNLFGVTLFFYLLKTGIEGFSGAGGYMSQRYFAASSDRAAGLLSLFWILLLAFRWPLVTAFAILGIHYGLTNTVIADPELVLPTVIDTYIPVGIKGLLVACFIAAAMSTFDSIINSSAAYWVKDIYQAYLNPSANNEQLILQSRLASIAVVLIGLLFSFPVVNINDIWGWITLGFGSGLFIPLLLRWYWWRFNGYGFAVGMIAGMVTAIMTKLSGISFPEYANFLIPASASFLGCMIGTLATPPTPEKVLDHFYQVTQPFGFWKPMRDKLSFPQQAKIQQENQRDLIAICIAVPWQLVLFLTGMILVTKQWEELGLLLLVLILLSIALYFTWFRHLGKTVKLPEEK